MRVGITSDLHYGIYPRVSELIGEFIERAIAPAGLDVLVVAGDLAETENQSGAEIGRNHTPLLARLREAIRCPVAFCAGNHDIWTTDPAVDSWHIYDTRLAEIAACAQATYLDQRSLELEGLTIVGCYGHFDFSLRTPDLAIGGVTVTDEHYRRQTPPGHTRPVWMDGRRIHWSFSDKDACAEVCGRAKIRMERALERQLPILFVSHTVPRNEVNGHYTSDRELSLFLNAFSGTSRLEDLIRLAASNDLKVVAVSGHTHRVVPRRELDGVHYLNVGGEYGTPRLEILEFSPTGDVAAG